MLHKEMENKTIDNVRVIDCFIIVMSDIFKLNCAIFNLLQFFCRSFIRFLSAIVLSVPQLIYGF
jgi:hypothetical protein